MEDLLERIRELQKDNEEFIEENMRFCFRLQEMAEERNQLKESLKKAGLDLHEERMKRSA